MPGMRGSLDLLRRRSRDTMRAADRPAGAQAALLLAFRVRSRISLGRQLPDQTERGKKIAADASSRKSACSQTGTGWRGERRLGRRWLRFPFLRLRQKPLEHLDHFLI
jgi:hypothetical protein